MLHEALRRALVEAHALLSSADLHVDELDTTQVTAALVLLSHHGKARSALGGTS